MLTDVPDVTTPIRGTRILGLDCHRVLDIGFWTEMLNADTKLYIDSYTNSKKPKLVNI